VYFLGGKGGRCVRLTTLPPSCAVVMKSGNLSFLEPSGPLQTCYGAALTFYILSSSPSKDTEVTVTCLKVMSEGTVTLCSFSMTICCQFEDTHYCSEVTNNSILQMSCDRAAVRLLNKGHFGVRAQNCEKRLLASSCSSVRPSARPPHGTTRLPLDGFSRNFTFEYFSENCPENLSFIKLWQE
jgi:hypothetical protein